LRWNQPPNTNHTTQQLGLIAGTAVQSVQLISYAYYGGGVVGTFNVTPSLSNLFVDTNQRTIQVLAATDQGYKLYLDRVHHNYKLVNQSPTECRLVIYDLISKVTKNTKSDPGSDWQKGLLATQVGVYATYEKIGELPTVSKEFNINWKIVGLHKYLLNGGQKLEHDFYFTPKRLVDMEYLNTFQQIRGITHCSLAVIYGSIYDDLHTDQVSAVAATTGVGYSQAKVVGVWDATYTTRIGIQGSRQRTFNTNLNITGTNKYVQGEDDGGVSNLSTVTEFA